MDEKVLKFVKDSITLTIGKQWEPIADLLDDRKYTNEFDIAKKLGITINQTRNLLYKLSDSGLVSSIRKKDKKKGWYTYFWKIEIVKCLEFYRNYTKTRLDQLNNQINSRETKQFYVCERCNIELTEENALLQDFTCQECGNIFKLRDNSKILKELKKNFDRYTSEIKLVDVEIESEKGKIGKKRESDSKREAKKKSKTRAKAFAHRKKEREMSRKSISKSVIKKIKKKAYTKKTKSKKVKKIVKNKSNKKRVKKKR